MAAPISYFNQLLETHVYSNIAKVTEVRIRYKNAYLLQHRVRGRRHFYHSLNLREILEYFTTTEDYNCLVSYHGLIRDRHLSLKTLMSGPPPSSQKKMNV